MLILLLMMLSQVQAHAYLGFSPGLAQRASVDDKPGTLATTKLPRLVRKKIEQVMIEFASAPPEERKAIVASVPLERVKLGPQGQWVWQATAPTDYCGSHAKCEHWLFDPKTGASLLSEALGTDFDILLSRHHGWRDLSASGYISDCENVTAFYHFDGHRYRLARTVDDKSGCDPGFAYPR
jgi:hypothetical protein